MVVLRAGGREQGSGCWAQGAGHRAQGAGHRAQNLVLLTPCPGATGFQLSDPGPRGSPEVRSSHRASGGPMTGSVQTLPCLHFTKWNLDPSFFFSANTEAGRLWFVYTVMATCAAPTQRRRLMSDLVTQTERYHALYLPEHIKNMWAHGESKAMSEESGNKWPNTPRRRKSSKTSLTWTP